MSGESPESGASDKQPSRAEQLARHAGLLNQTGAYSRAAAELLVQSGDPELRELGELGQALKIALIRREARRDEGEE